MDQPNNKIELRKHLKNELEGKPLIYKIINGICVFFLTLMVLDVSIIVAGRFLFQKTPGWGEPLALLCVIWFSLLSPANALTDNRHLRVGYFLDRYPEEVRSIFNVIFYIIFFGISLFMIVKGGALTWQIKRSVVPGLNISQAFRYAAIPVSGLALFWATLKKCLNKELI
jgi:TRAP-type transport system small permease protein